MAKREVLIIALIVVLITVAWLLHPRYQMMAPATTVGAYKIDSWTGNMWFCAPHSMFDNSVVKGCHKLEESWWDKDPDARSKTEN